MKQDFISHLELQLEEIKNSGLYKEERIITSPQSSLVQSSGKDLINLCSNNYLGLSSHPVILEKAQTALKSYGYGLSSVRFICGTQDIHKQLERKLSDFLRQEDCILYSSCFDANGGLFETLLTEDDAIISDSLNHASIIDGIRLCKAKRFRYRNNDMEDLKSCLEKAHAAGARHCLIATDGVFSMDGYIAKLKDICDLADRFEALVMVDDSHATGFVGDTGRGTPEHCGVMDRIDILTGTLGKALGGASGGYTAAKKPIIDLLRQKSRPYLFSNSLAPVIAATSITAIDMISENKDLLQRLKANTRYFRTKMSELGFRLLPGEHPIIPIMLGDAKLAAKMSESMLARGIYVVGFSFPVVPRGEARIRTQMSAALSQQDLDKAISAFADVGRELKII